MENEAGSRGLGMWQSVSVWLKAVGTLGTERTSGVWTEMWLGDRKSWLSVNLPSEHKAQASRRLALAAVDGLASGRKQGMSNVRITNGMWIIIQREGGGFCSLSEPFLEPLMTLSDGIWSCPGFPVLGNRVGGCRTGAPETANGLLPCCPPPPLDILELSREGLLWFSRS